MKSLSTLFLSTTLLLTACNADHSSQDKKESSTESTTETKSNKDKSSNTANKNVKPYTEQQAKKVFGSVEKLSPGKTKKYPVKGVESKNISKVIKVKDNETIIYSEDTGHGIPTIPAGENHEFTAISEVTYKDLKMYMLQDGRFITADPNHVKIISSDKSAHFYPKFEMHEEDYKYLDTLNKNDKDYLAYENYAKNFGATQYDSKRELLMFTAIHQVNNETEGSFVIEDTPFKSFEDFKSSK